MTKKIILNIAVGLTSTLCLVPVSVLTIGSMVPKPHPEHVDGSIVDAKWFSEQTLPVKGAIIGMTIVGLALLIVILKLYFW